MSVVNTFIVEDSPIIRDNLISALEEMAPVEVIGHAADELSALGWLRAGEQTCDLVIIDVFLKSGSGLGVLRALAQAGHPSRRVVLTNYATSEMRRQCAALGADRVFDKSTELDDLIAYCARMADVDAGSESDSDSGPVPS